MSQVKEFTFTLSRAHKIAERLKRQINVSARQAADLVKPVNLYSVDQASELDDRLAKLDEVRAKLTELHRVRTEVRVLIAVENGKIGQHTLLTQQKDIVAHLAQLGQLRNEITSYNDYAKPRNQLESQLASMTGTKSGEGVSTKAVSAEFIQGVNDDISRLTADLDKLNDQVADNNASTKITVSIPVELASELGLV